jgi:hypothetical protein
MVPRTEGYAYDVGVWDLSIVEGPFCHPVPIPNVTIRHFCIAVLVCASTSALPLALLTARGGWGGTVFASIAKPDYFASFYFWLDGIATCSLVLDIPEVFEGVCCLWRVRIVEGGQREVAWLKEREPGMRSGSLHNASDQKTNGSLEYKPRSPSPPTVNGNTVRSFSTHGQQSAAQGSSTTVSRSDIRLIHIWTPRLAVWSGGGP